LRPGFKQIDFNATLFRPATFIEQAIGNLSQSMVIAAFLLILVLGAFLYGWRTTLISLLVIPVTLLAGLGILYLRGESLNVMVLAGLVIALGIVIDEVVIDMDQLMRRLRQNQASPSPMPVENVILEALSETRNTIFFGALITLLAIMPVFFVEGSTGALLKPLAISYSLAVVAALLAALFLTPALCLIFLPNTKLDERGSPFVNWLQRRYDQVLANTVQKPGLALAVVVVLIVIGLAMVPFIRQDQLLPTFREPYILVKLNGAPATSRVEMDRIVARISTELQSVPGIQNVGAHVGRAVFGDQIVGINSAELWVNIDPKANYDATLATIHQTMAGYTGLNYSVKTYINQTIGEPQANPANTLTLRVFGDDLAVLNTQAENLRQSLTGIKGISDSRVDVPVKEPTVEIEVDLATAQRFGVKPGEVRRAAATMLSGLPVGSLFEEQKVFDVVVWSPLELRDSLSDIRMMPIETPGGGYIHLDDVADVRIVDSPTVIHREGVSAYLDIILSLQGRDSQSVARDVEASIKSFAFPLEYHAEVLTDYAKQQAAMQRMLTAVIIALVGIFLLLQAASGNWRLATVTFLALPSTLAGGALATFLVGGNLSITSVLGLLAVLGIAARNSIMLIRRYEQDEREEGLGVNAGLVQRGTREQAAPILMTALMTAFTLLPFALAGDAPGLEIVRPMAFIILGGLVTSSVFNLLVMPAFYLKFGASREADLGFQPVAKSNLPAAADD
jgi:Cu/Ag efflux pump CusA